jgi:alpha-amylase
MADRLVTYVIAHQPRRPKLPAEIIPRDLPPDEWHTRIFDDPMNRFYMEKVARWCYYPAIDMFLNLADKGYCLAVGLSWSLVEQMQQWDPTLLERFKTLLHHPNVEPVGVEPYHSFLFYMDIETFITRMKWARDQLSELAGKPVRITDTTEMFMSNDLYYALGQAGFEGVMIDGREWVMGWRQASYLYHMEPSPKIFCRHFRLSDDVGYRFSNTSWSGWPLIADNYATWIKDSAGDMVFIGWDFETFGEHHNKDSGIFEFMGRLPDALKVRGVHSMTPSQALEELKDESRELPIPQFPGTWAGSGGVEFFLGNGVQQAVFQLMHHAYNKALLTKNPVLIDLAMQLMTSDHLHTLQWWNQSGSEAEVSMYFTPDEWMTLGSDGIVTQVQEVYKQFILACDPHVAIKKPKKAATKQIPIIS